MYRGLPSAPGMLRNDPPISMENESAIGRNGGSRNRGPKGMDIMGLVNGVECRCGFSAINRQVC